VNGPATVPPEKSTRVARVARVVVAGAALVPIGVYVYVALRQLGYPFELEWLEGGAVEIVARAAHGHSLYVAPSLRYVPYPYTPLYFWVAAAVAKVTGISFLPLRLVSFTASLGCFGLLYAMVRRETGDRVAGLVSAGLFAATYQVSDAWFDIGRVDSLYLFFLLGAVALARRADGGRDGLLVGLAVFLAFFTKQSALIAAAPLLVLLVVTRRRTGLVAVATTVVAVVGSTLVLNALTQDWYGYYVFTELFHQGVVSSVWATFVPHDLLRPTGLAIALGVIGLVVGWRRNAAGWVFWVAVTAGMVGSSLVARLHSGGGPDVLIPAYAAVALLAGLGYAAVLRRDVTHRQVVSVALAAVVLLQVVVLAGHPAHLVPNARSEAAGWRFVATVAQRPGDVIVLDHPWYETMAGKPAWAQGEALHDLLRSGPSPARNDLRASIAGALASPDVTTIFADNPSVANLPGFRAHFRSGPAVFDCYRCFFPVTDLATRPYLRYDRN
jgi:hypothetical protein